MEWGREWFEGKGARNMSIKQAEECNQESGEDETVETER